MSSAALLLSSLYQNNSYNAGWRQRHNIFNVKKITFHINLLVRWQLCWADPEKQWMFLWMCLIHINTCIFCWKLCSINVSGVILGFIQNILDEMFFSSLLCSELCTLTPVLCWHVPRYFGDIRWKFWLTCAGSSSVLFFEIDLRSNVWSWSEGNREM